MNFFRSRAGTSRRLLIAPLEFAIVLSGVGAALGLLAFSNHSTSTFERDLPLVGITLEIQSHIGESQQTTFEVLAGDVDADEQQIFVGLDHATEDCRTLVFGGDTRLGSVAPLREAADRRSAAALCSGILELASLTRRLLQEPVARGEGTEFDERYDLAVAQLTERTEALSVALRQDVADDASAVDRLGTALAWSVLLLAAVMTVLANWQRRTLAAKTGELIRLGVIVNASSDGILSMTPEGTVTAWNRGAENLYGWRAEEIVGRDVGELVPPSRREEEDKLLARVRRGEEVMSETERVRKDGSLVPVALTVSPIFEGEVVTGIASIQQDITERLAKDAELVVAREQALEASRQKTEFLSTMSHEIRTPMNGVIGLTGLLLQSDLDEQQRQHAQGVRSAGESLMTLINEILDFSKIEASKLELETLDFNLVHVVEEAAELVATQAQRKGLELLAYCSPELPLALRGDPSRLRQVLLNLASNAIKFTAEGEVVIRVRVEDLDATGVVVRFEVTDTGVGISEADQERLFEPFVQADSSTTRHYGGTGLGLAISRRLVTAMGGALGVDSEAGRGSTFWFTLPLGLAKDETVARPVSTAGLAGLRVLVVDDNHTNRLILAEQLGAWGMRLGVAEDGESAIRCLQEAAIGDDPYDLALLDMCMPGMDGLQLATRISGDSALPSTALVLLTSAQELRLEEARQAGISAQLTKPIHMSRLVGALHDSLGLVRPDPNTVAPPLSQPRAPGSRGHLLVAEDNYVNQLVATGILKRLGYTTEVASNGIEAVAAFDRTSFSAVLMDCQMPEMDGYAATKTIRTRGERGRGVPIIAMTASATESDRQRCLTAGMDDFISKPVDAEALDGTLSRWISHFERGADTPANTTPGPEQAVLDESRLESLRTMKPGDSSLLDRVVTAFLNSSADSLATLTEALQARSASDLGNAAHRLKGGAAQIGAPRVAAVCEELELLGELGDLEPASEALSRLQHELEAATAALQALTAK